MICASFLTKYLLIDWRWGLKYYYQHLVDADIYSNTAGWGFVSSTGPDAVPYFRAPFNPFIQSKKFDLDTEYIKKWMPSLSQVDARDLHKWYDEKVRAKYPELMHYKPIVDYSEQKQRVLAAYKP
jgi:deoxyribodipyrimidine photo-lyase